MGRLKGGSFRVIYLTGAPASGKSSVTRDLGGVVSPLEIFEYGERLTSYLAARQEPGLTQESVRRRSAGIVEPEDVKAVDRMLLRFVAEARSRAHVVIDTHAVTKESYGFRVTPYSLDDFALLSPDAICVLFLPPEVAIDRIKHESAGRPAPTLWESSFHTSAQGSVALAYGVGLGIPVYFVNSNRPNHDVLQDVARLFGARGTTRGAMAK